MLAGTFLSVCWPLSLEMGCAVVADYMYSQVNGDRAKHLLMGLQGQLFLLHPWDIWVGQAHLLLIGFVGISGEHCIPRTVGAGAKTYLQVSQGCLGLSTLKRQQNRVLFYF